MKLFRVVDSVTNISGLLAGKILASEEITIPAGEIRETVRVGASFGKYFLAAEGSGGAQCCEVTAFRLSSGIVDSLTNKLGFLNIVIQSKQDGSDIYLEITNNELFTITVTSTYMNN